MSEMIERSWKAQPASDPAAGALQRLKNLVNNGDVDAEVALAFARDKKSFQAGLGMM